MNRVERLLRHLKNGKWHKKTPQKTGVHIWQSCVRLKLVREKWKLNKRTGNFNVELKITALGKKMLEKGTFPSREDLSRILHPTSTAGIADMF